MDAEKESLGLADTAKNPETGAQNEWKEQAAGPRMNARRAVVLWSILLILVVPPVGVLALLSACLTKLLKSEKMKKLSFRIAKICCIVGTVASAAVIIYGILK